MQLGIDGEYIVYPSIYKLNYEKNSAFNLDIIENTFAKDKKNVEIYHLEALNICNLSDWNNCFQIINIPYNNNKFNSVYEYLKSELFKNLKKKDKRRILENGRVEINYELFGEICCDIQKIFSGNFNYVGKNFSKIPLITGNIQNYVFQFFSNSVYGIPNVFMGIQNLPEINNIINKIPKTLIKNLTKPEILNSLYKSYIERILENDQNELFRNDVFLFRKKTAIESSIFLRAPNLNFDTSSENLMNYLADKVANIHINDSFWKIHFILN